jgi:tRNA(Ile)-lysidine synthase
MVTAPPSALVAVPRAVRRTLADRALVRAGDGVVVAVSGGPDSTALLHVLSALASELDLRLFAVGVDHGLRASAALELDGAEAVARSVFVPFERVRISTKPTGASVQAWAREARYEVLRAAATRLGARVIATGHTADDQAETVLARLLRGGGLRGLGGIDPARADGIIRPLIDCRRDALRAYLSAAGVPFALDPSNLEPRFERTRIRDAIVPALVAEQPLAVERLAAIADEARDADRAMDAAAAGLLARASRPRGLSIVDLTAAPAPIAMRALRRWAEAKSSRAIGRAHLVALIERLHASGEVLLPGGWIVRRGADVLELEPPRDDVRERPPRSATSAPSDGPGEQGSDEEE